MANVLDVRFLKDQEAQVVTDKWVTWNAARAVWLAEKKELRQYLFATDTRKTTNGQLPWKNSTVTPKLTQIRDNLHANYMAALFPREDWFKWRAGDQDSASKNKRDTIEAYMRTKLDASDFEQVVSQLVLDYIDYGNVFAGHEYVCDKKVDPADGEESVIYAGPKGVRISPLDIVFDVTSSTFAKSPCIVRRLKSLGDLAKDMTEKPALQYNPDVIDKVNALRVAGADQIDALKNDGLIIDGFGSINLYFASGMVELLDFYGDIYDQSTGTFLCDQIITVIDRRWVLRKGPNESWTGSRPIKHCGWRTRPDNLWAQGPLDQLVGMQYRIDHLENLKADVFDQIAHPIVIIKGSTVEDFTFGPGAKAICGDDGSIDFERPDAAALTADMEINVLMGRMEELAGAPKQAMGIRSPGEKTKYEIQVLENGAGRIFHAKVNWLERNIIEPMLDSMLEESVRRMGAKDAVLMTDPDYGTQSFKNITKEDITAKGRFSAIGARHYAEEAMFIQELSQTLTLIEKIPSVAVHVSGKAVAHGLSEVLGWKSFGIVKDNAAVIEGMETERLKSAGSENLGTEAVMPSEQQTADMMPPNVPRNTTA